MDKGTVSRPFRPLYCLVKRFVTGPQMNWQTQFLELLCLRKDIRLQNSKFSFTTQFQTYVTHHIGYVNKPKYTLFRLIVPLKLLRGLQHL